MWWKVVPHVDAGNWESKPATVERRNDVSDRRWEAEDSNRCLDVTPARQVKRYGKYPGVVPLMARYVRTASL